MIRTRELFAAVFFLTMPCLFAEGIALWKEALGGKIISEISAHLGTISAVLEGGSVRAYGASGKIFWDYKTQGRFLPFLARSASSASFFCRSNGEFIALNRTGDVQWRLSLNEHIKANPISGWDERVFIFLEKKILCYSHIGMFLWQLPLDSELSSAAQLSAEGGFIAISKSNSIIRVSPFGKKSEIPLFSAPNFILPVMLVSQKGIEAGILAIYSDGRLELYDGENKARGNLSHLGAAPLAAAAFKGSAAVQLATGELVVFDVESGKVRWRTESRPGVGAADNNEQKIKIKFEEQGGEWSGITVLSISGVASFGKDGAKTWSLSIENAAVTPAFEDGIVYVGGKDWILSAWQTAPRSKERRLYLPARGRYGLGLPLARREWSAFREGTGGDFDSYLSEAALQIARGAGKEELYIVRALLAILGDKHSEVTQRVEAARLLGLLGSMEIIPFLARRLLAEENSAVLTEIALTLGKLGSDPDERVLLVFERLIRGNIAIGDEMLLSAITEAIGNMCRFSGPPVSERGTSLLVRLSVEASSSAVRRRAQRELELLRNEK